jgi:hypothetical protein
MRARSYRWIVWLGVLLITPGLASAQYKSLKGRFVDGQVSREISIPDGKVVLVSNFVLTRPSSAGLQTFVAVHLSLDGFKILEGRVLDAHSSLDDRATVIPGPAKFRIESPKGAEVNYYFSYRLMKNSDGEGASVAPTVLPTNTVVIPEDERGEVRIVLEASPYLVNWAEALPGRYRSSTNHRFFRIRAVASPD